MPRVRFFRFTVEGTGVFPVDMLRYDACYPERTEDALGLVVDRHDEAYREKRQVRLVTSANRQPTVDRWNSFGWYLVPGSLEKVY